MKCNCDQITVDERNWYYFFSCQGVQYQVCTFAYIEKYLLYKSKGFLDHQCKDHLHIYEQLCCEGTFEL